MTQVPVFEAEHFFPCQTLLGEGILWDSKTQLLHWVDIDNAEVHTLDTKTKKHSVDVYPETSHIGTIAMREKEGLLASFRHTLVEIPAPTTPTEAGPVTKKNERKSLKTLSEPLPREEYEVTRFNDGNADPHGRMFHGSMTLPTAKDGRKRGQLWRYDPDGKEAKIIEEVGTSNGLGWSPDHKTMYYVDSGDDVIVTFDFDSSSNCTNKKLFANPPDAMDDQPTTGVFDGLCMDGLGNIWVARWKDRRIIGYTPEGKIICYIRTPQAKSPTIPCFGGKNLDEMYIITAHSKLANEGEIQDQYPHSGDLFKMDFGPGSEIRKLLGDNWKGAERYRYRG